MTEKLYYADSHMRRFEARVVSCEKRSGGGWAVELDRTAFFPEGGGQPGDCGTLGGAAVSDTHESGGRILHYTDAPLDAGAAVSGEIDWLTRFRRMQNHSGEHIVSGLICARRGLNNVGFHIGADDVTIDFDGELTRPELDEIELLANLAVAENISVRAWFPSPDELEKISYRSKGGISGDVRIVQIGGYDTCACCAPHVERTGEVGIIKLLDFERHRGGVRIHMLCGLDALADYGMRYRATAEISAMLSAKQNETPRHVRRTLDELDSARFAAVSLKRRLISARVAAMTPTGGSMCLFEDETDTDILRELACAASPLCGGVCAVFGGSDGSWKYVISGTGLDMSAFSRGINAAIGGRGGGRGEVIQGSASASRRDIEAYFANTSFR